MFFYVFFYVKKIYLFFENNGATFTSYILNESLILAQNERWRRGLGMQVERDLLV